MRIVALVWILCPSTEIVTMGSRGQVPGGATPLPPRVEFRPEIIVREQVESRDRRIIKPAKLVGVTAA